MKKLLLYIILLALAHQGYSQKPLINDTSYNSWTTVSRGSLNSNGKFASYFIQNKPLGGNTFVVTATDKSWQFESISYLNANFSNDGHYLFAINGNDSLVQLNLQTKKFFFIPHCKGYELYSRDKNEYLIYRLDNLTNDLIIQNLATQKKIVLSNITEYIINKAGLAIITKIKSNSTFPEIMRWTDLTNGQSKLIYQGKETGNQIFNLSGSITAFTTIENNYTKVWIYTDRDSVAQLVASDSSKGILKGYKISIDNNWKFTSNSSGIFFTQSLLIKNDESSDPTIWNYQDAFLRSYYDKNKNGIYEGTNLSIIDLHEKKIRRLLDGVKKVKGGIPELNNDLLLVESTFARTNEQDWNKYAEFTYYLLNVKTGKLRIIRSDVNVSIEKMVLSPDNQFIVYYDPSISQYISINTRNDKSTNISSSISGELYRYSISDRGKPRGRSIPGGMLGWLKQNKHILVQGTFDIWDLDLEGKDRPVNLTQGKKKNNEIIFSLLNGRVNFSISENEEVLLSGFNQNNKNYGIYSLRLKTRELRPLFISNSDLGVPYENIPSVHFQKAANSNSYLIVELNSDKSLNYLYTKDFIKFFTLSNNHPEANYNWITSELLTYNDKSGNLCEAILYKPENFDPLKKYPVIFTYYMDQSNSLNHFESPEPSNTGLNIPLLVSNGYIVCKPNIYRIIGNPGKAALNSILAAADYLSSLNYIDSSKMAVAGHSFGGFETNYILTHSNRFKAALVGAGPSNLTESYNELWAEEDDSKQDYLKNGFYLMGKGMEKDLNNYIENSPILSAINISTPILLLHNKNDKSVPVRNSLNLFVQLRSLEKPVWLVQYNDETHILLTEKNEIDFQGKVKGFLDYYLKDQPKPIWMTKHIGDDISK